MISVSIILRTYNSINTIEDILKNRTILPAIFKSTSLETIFVIMNYFMIDIIDNYVNYVSVEEQ